MPQMGVRCGHCNRDYRAWGSEEDFIQYHIHGILVRGSTSYPRTGMWNSLLQPNQDQIIFFYLAPIRWSDPRYSERTIEGSHVVSISSVPRINQDTVREWNRPPERNATPQMSWTAYRERIREIEQQQQATERGAVGLGFLFGRPTPYKDHIDNLKRKFSD